MVRPKITKTIKKEPKKEVKEEVRPIVIIKLAVNGQEYKQGGDGKTQIDAILDALSKFKPTTMSEGIFTIIIGENTKTVPCPIRKMRQMFEFGDLVGDAQRVALAEKLLV